MPTELFRATPAELSAACGGWREPLDEPVQREVLNPFTSTFHSIASYDPRPSEPIPDYPSDELPGPSIEIEGFDKLGVDALLRLFFDDGSADARIAARERPPLIHPADGPWLLDVPAPLVERLAAVTETDLPSLGARWAALFRAELKRHVPTSSDVLVDSFYVDALSRIVVFARETVAAGQRVYEWHAM